MIEHHRITIVRIRKPEQPDINQDLQWFGTSLGLFNLRDKDKSCFRLFIELLKAAKMGVPASSDELAHTVGLSRGTVVHHLNHLITAGIIRHRNQGYMLRAETLKDLVSKLKDDMEKYFDNLSSVAQEIDKVLKL